MMTWTTATTLFGVAWTCQTTESTMPPRCEKDWPASQAAMSWSALPPQPNVPLRGGGALRVPGKDLPHQGREGHVQRGVQLVGQRDAVVLQDLHHRGGIVCDNDTRLLHAQQTRF